MGVLPRQPLDPFGRRLAGGRSGDVDAARGPVRRGVAAGDDLDPCAGVGQGDRGGHPGETSAHDHDVSPRHDCHPFGEPARRWPRARRRQWMRKR